MFRDISGHSGVLGCSVVFQGVAVFRGVPGCSSVPVFWCSGVPVFRCSGVFRGVPVFLVSVHAQRNCQSCVFIRG